MEIRKSASIFLKGFGMGMADIVPGVSGGTIALLTGIYERLVRSLSRINFKFIGAYAKGDSAKARKYLNRIDFEFFLPLVLGIALAVILMSNIITYCLEDHASATYAFFFALILLSAFMLYGEIKRISFSHLTATLLGFGIIYFLVGFRDLELISSHNLFIIFISGMVAVCAMILPGISGALILLIIGQYGYMLDSLKGLDLPVIFAFIIGGVIALLAFSKILNHIMKRHRAITLTFLIGMMLGALRIPYEEIVITDSTRIPIIIAVTLGVLIIVLLEIYRRKANIRKIKKRANRS